jgi:plastocyanin
MPDMQTRHIIASSVAGLAALALAGCGSDSAGSSATIPADAGLVVYAGPGIKFDKTDYTATAGTVKVAYSNRDAQRHSLDIVNSDKTVIGSELVVGKSGDLEVGSYDLPAGTYTLECLVPGHDSMRATLTVTGG